MITQKNVRNGAIAFGLLLTPFWMSGRVMAQEPAVLSEPGVQKELAGTAYFVSRESAIRYARSLQAPFQSVYLFYSEERKQWGVNVFVQPEGRRSPLGIRNSSELSSQPSYYATPLERINGGFGIVLGRF